MDSELQIALIGAGIAAVVLVVGYNKWQERRHRREAERAEVVRTIERVVDKLLHTPTVRVKEFAGSGLGGSYARALSELFDLDPRALDRIHHRLQAAVAERGPGIVDGVVA